MSKREADGARASPHPERRLRVYVAAVIAASLGALFVFSPPLGELIRPQFWLWLAACLGAEFLWLETKSGEATDSMASTVNLAVIYLFGFGLSLWIVGISVFLATRFIQKRNLVKSIFGFSQMVLTTLAAGLVFRALGGSEWGLSELRTPTELLPCLAAGVAYSVVNPGLVSVAVALEKGLCPLKTWKENYGYRNFLLSSLALFVLSPLLLIAFLGVGYWGVLLFFLPMLIVKNQNKEYIELQRTHNELRNTMQELERTLEELKKMQDALVIRERMAAMGDMAGGIAHEMRNYLQILKSRSEVLMGKATRAGDSGMIKDACIMREQMDRMMVQVRGLLDSTRQDVTPEPTDVNKLTTEVVEFNKAHNLFDKIDIQLDLEPGVGYWSVDPGRMHQVLTNLLRNAGDAINGAQVPAGIIKLTSRVESNGGFRLTVEDNGPGVPPDLSAKIFEPHFTTKKQGNGYGLSTCYMIMQSHGGSISVDASPLGGARFHLTLPETGRAGAISPSVARHPLEAGPLQTRSRGEEPPEVQRRAG